MGQPETAADEAAVAEEPLDLAGYRVRCDVEVLGGPPQEQVADAPPHQVGGEAVVMEPVERAQGVRADQLAGYAVLVSGYDAWLHGAHHTTTERKSEVLESGCVGMKSGIFSLEINTT